MSRKLTVLEECSQALDEIERRKKAAAATRQANRILKNAAAKEQRGRQKRARRASSKRQKMKQARNQKPPEKRKETYEQQMERIAKLITNNQRVWPHDYDAYITSVHWESKRSKAFDHYGRVCNRCQGTVHLQVHHKTYKRLGIEKMEDLEVLCRGCHHKEHKKTKPRKGRSRKRSPVDSLTKEYQNIIRGC